MVLDADRFDRSLFINCPFDPEYRPLLHTLIFTVLECGLEPRLAVDNADSGQVRIYKVRDLIRSCRFSIHDISRIEPLREGDLPRFNMPFELGLDMGCRYYGGERLESKQCLILERERFRYQRVLSDLSGNDIRAHGGDPNQLTVEVRNWLKVVTGGRLQSGSSILDRYNLFQWDLDLMLEHRRYFERDVDSLEVVEYIEMIRDWQTRQPAPPIV
jgi:hypothetical protein